MTEKKRYQVAVECLVHVPVGGTLATLYRGNVLPEGVDPKRIEFWLDGGMIAEVGGSDDAVVGPPADKDEGATEPATKPTAKSTKPELVAYAISQGVPEDEAKAMTVKDLQARYVTAE